jgi:hypothetical protein
MLFLVRSSARKSHIDQDWFVIRKNISAASHWLHVQYNLQETFNEILG